MYPQLKNGLIFSFHRYVQNGDCKKIGDMMVSKKVLESEGGGKWKPGIRALWGLAYSLATPAIILLVELFIIGIKMKAICTHRKVQCLNQYEFIRKYLCEDCNEVMMCLCDKDFGMKFLPHQLNKAVKLESQDRIPVTLGFQPHICRECNGLEVIAAPKKSRPGYTSKVHRYYWREIYFETTKRFYNSHPELDPLNNRQFEFNDERKKIEKEVIGEIKSQHLIAPKYNYSEQSQEQIIKSFNIEVIQARAEYEKSDSRKAKLKLGTHSYSAEQYAIKYFESKGFSAFETESIPFHVIFGVYMWPIIQDLEDKNSNIVFFGNRHDFELGLTPRTIQLNKPSDFGTSNYYKRRESFINDHISMLTNIDNLFDIWLPKSEELRQYLWAHKERDIEISKKVISILGSSNIKKILIYLNLSYWKNYCGWPDLLVYNPNEFFFVEVKSSNDKLSEDQKNWIKGNYNNLKFNFKIFKIGKL